MKRERLIAARLAMGWTQEKAAERIGVSWLTLSKWERGQAKPYPINVQRLCDVYQQPAENLGLVEETQHIPQDALQTVIQLFSGSPGMDIQRRQILQFFEVLGIATLGADIIPQGPSIAVEEFLPQCDSALRGCWHLMKGNGLPIAEEILGHNIPMLTTLCSLPGQHQETAAALTTQAKIIQAILAMHRLNLVAREAHCNEAVKYGRIAGDSGLLAAALMTQGYTYTYCIRRPQKAIQSYQEALIALGEEESLLRSDIYMGLADAYAQVKKEQEARRAIGLAKEYFPQHPKQDPRFLYADITVSELYQWEGKMFLDLAQHYPKRGHYQRAYDAFEQSANIGCIAKRSDAETLIHQADAARGIGDLEHYTSCLEQGTRMALSIGSQKRYSEACNIYKKTPVSWKNEGRVKALKDMFVTRPVRAQ